MKIPTIDEIMTMDITDLEKTVFGSFERTQFDLQRVPIDELTLSQEEITIDDLKPLFNMNFESSIFGFPYVDERDQFQEEFMGYRLLPDNGFFWVIRPVIRERMFGLVDVEFTINKFSKKDNDERWENQNRVFRDMKNFYFDYDQHRYVQIIKKGKNPDTEEYFRREKLYSGVLHRLKRENSKFRKEVAAATDYFSKKETKDVNELIEYFSRFLRFEEETVPFLKFKFLLGQIDSENNFTLKQFVHKISKEIKEEMVKLEDLKSDGKTDRFSEVGMFEYSRWFEKLHRTKQKIQSLFTLPKKKDKHGTKKIDGFYSFNENRLFGNFCYLEWDRTFKIEPGSVENRRKEEKELLESLLKGSDEIEEVGELSILTPEEIKERDRKPNSKERMSYVVDCLQQKVKQGLIERNEVSMYLMMYK